MLAISEPVLGIYLVEFHEPLTEDDLDRWKEERERVLATGRPHVLVIESRIGIARSNRKIRGLIRWHKSHKERIARLTLGYAMVVASPVMRQFVKVLFLAVRPGPKVTFARDRNAALQWAGELLAMHRVKHAEG